MFGKKNRGIIPHNKDLKLLLDAMDAIIEGNYNETDVSAFRNPIYGQKLNAVIHSLKNANNAYVMRMNEVMEAVGNNALIKDTFDKVTSQTKSIHNMEDSSQNMENAINNISGAMGDIRNNTQDILTTFQSITQNMNDSIQVVNESSDQIQIINSQMQDFKEKINKIGEIIDIVKKVAFQSNLLALNASIEAAKAGTVGNGFAVVADEMRQLSVSTAESAENITDYVKQLSQDTEILAVSMNKTARKLNEGNAKVETSLNNMQQMNSQIGNINTRVNSVFEAIDTQTNTTIEFSRQIEHLSESYDLLSKDCIALGKHVFQIGRYIDKTRSDMVRRNSAITELDWIRVFEVDHFVLIWRVYNNIVGFEHLQAKQVDNPANCKLGKWLSKQTDRRLTDSNEFKQLVSSHTAIHNFATRSWSAKEEGNDELAMKYFYKTYDAFMVFDKAIKGIQDKMRTIGYHELTEIVPFKK